MAIRPLIDSLEFIKNKEKWGLFLELVLLRSINMILI